MNKKISLMAIYMLLAMTCNMSAMENQENNSLAEFPQVPSNSPYNQSESPITMKRSPSSEDLKKKLLDFKFSSSGSRSQPGSISGEEITPRSKSTLSSSREPSPIRKNNDLAQSESSLEEVIMGELSKNCSSPNVYKYKSMKEDKEGFLCATFEKNGKKQKIKAAISAQNENYGFLKASDENGELFFVQLIEPGILGGFIEIDKQLQQQEKLNELDALLDSEEKTVAKTSQAKQKTQDSAESEISPKSKRPEEFDKNIENPEKVNVGIVKVELAQKTLGDQPKDPNKRFHFYVGLTTIAALTALITIYMYKYNKLPDFMINFINKLLPVSYSR